jgi:CBS domain-containing protein
MSPSSRGSEVLRVAVKGRCTAGDSMTREVETLRRNDPLSIADDLMKQKRIRHLPVLDEDGELAGIVSQRDLFEGDFVVWAAGRAGG